MARKATAKLLESDNVEPQNRRATSINTNANNHLKIRIDDLKTFQPLTENQKIFFDAYKRGDYFVALHGVAGTGKTFIALYKAIEEVLDKLLSEPPKQVYIEKLLVEGDTWFKHCVPVFS